MSVKALMHLLMFLLCTTQTIGLSDEAPRVYIVYMGETKNTHHKILADLHRDILANILRGKGVEDSMLYSYKHGFSGFAAKITPSQAQKLAEHPEVVSIIRNEVYKQHTTRSFDYLGLSSSSVSSPNSLLESTNSGDGMVIGLVDTGIWPELDVFDDKGLGPVPSRWKGICETGLVPNSTIKCNKKLIGARFFMMGFVAENGMDGIKTYDYLSARDSSGHGTHTSTIAAGSRVTGISYNGIGKGTVRGGAPRAHIAMYKVLWYYGPGIYIATTADILKAMDEAIHDGVDVLSLSLGQSSFSVLDLKGEDTFIGSFHAVAKGILVVCAGGNGGPLAYTIVNASPWILTVAASTMDRSFITRVKLGNNQTIMAEAANIGPRKSSVGLFHSDTWSNCDEMKKIVEDEYLNKLIVGKFVLCFTTQPEGMWAAVYPLSDIRAAGVIVAKNPTRPPPISDSYHSIPCIEVEYETGLQIKKYIDSTRSPHMSLAHTKTIVGNPIPTVIPDFSSRGPSVHTPEILKPDIAAPGVNILAGISPKNKLSEMDHEYVFMSGTSMSTPLVAGIAALLKSLHNDWSPSAIKSAIVTTAWTTDPFGEPIISEGSIQNLANPFDYGGGILNPSKAADPGLIYNITTEGYISFLCAMGYGDDNISKISHQHIKCQNIFSMLNLNVPSITIPNLQHSITVTRTVTNVGPVNSTYTTKLHAPIGITIVVSPSVLAFNPTTKIISFTVTISSSHKVNTGYYFGSLTWVDGIHSVRIPISVRTRITQA